VYALTYILPAFSYMASPVATLGSKFLFHSTFNANPGSIAAGDVIHFTPAILFIA